MRFTLLIVLFLGLCCCTCQSDKKEKVDNPDSTLHNNHIGSDSVSNKDVDYFKLDSYLVSEVDDTATLVTVGYNCAIVLSPTSEQIESMKKEYGEDFYTIADDATYYEGTAIGLLDSVKIKTVFVTKPNVKLIGTKKSWTLNLSRKRYPAWNIVFFTKMKEPKVIGLAGITRHEIEDYFGIGQ